MKIGDDISMNLTLTTSDFVYQVKKSNELLKELRKALQDTAEVAKRADTHFSGISGSFRHFMQMAATARFAMLDFHDVFLRLPLAVIKTSGEIERMTKLMEGLSTATDKVADANKSKDFVFSLAQNAPFDVKTLTDSFVKLKSGGIDPMNGSMQALVNSVAKFGGTSDQLHRASIAIQQMGGKGVVSMEELRQQLGEAVPNAIEMMAMGVGKSMQDLVKAISNGEVESKSALERMFAVMAVQNYGAAQDMMQTWTGMFEQLKTKWELFKYAVGGGTSGEGVFSEARNEVQLLLDSFDGNAARAFGADLSEMMYELAHGFRSITEGAIKFYEELKTVGTVLLLTFAGTKLHSIMAGAKAEFAQLSLTYRKSAQEYILAEQEKAAAALKALENEKMKTQMNVFMMEDELAAKKAQVIALAREQQIATNAYVAHTNVVKTAMIDKFIVEQATINASRELAAASLATANAYGVEGRALQSQIAVMEANMAAMRASIATKEQMIVASNALNASVTTSGKAMAGMKGVFNAMGGWLTVLTAAIMAAVWAWEEFGNAAEKNAERHRRAINGMGDKKDLESIDDQIKERERKLKNAERGRKLGLKGANSEEEIAEQRNELKKLYDDRKIIEDDILKREIEDAARSAKRKSEINIAAKTKAIREEKDAISRYATNEANRINNDSSLSAKAREDALKKNRDWETVAIKDVGKRLFESEAKVHTEAMESLTDQIEKASGNEKVKLQAIYDGHKDALKKSKDSLADVDKIGTSNVSMKGKSDKGTGPQRDQSGTLDRAMADAERNLKYLEAQGSRLEGEIDRAQEIIDRVDAKYDDLIDSNRLTITSKNAKGKNVTRNFDKNNAGDVAKLEELKQKEIQVEKLKAAQALLKTETNSLNKEQADYDQQMQTTGLRSEFVSSKIRQLNDEFAKQRANLKGIDIAQAEAANSQRIFVAAQQDARAYLKVAQEESLRAEIDTTTNAQEKVLKQYQLTTLRLQAEYDQRVADMLDAIEKSTASEIDKEIKKQEELARIRQAYELKKQAEERRFNEATKSSMAKLAEEWGNVTNQMDKASAKWMESFADEMTKAVTGGKTDFRSLATSILKDMSGLFMRKALSGLMPGAGGPGANLGGGFLNMLSPGMGNMLGGMLNPRAAQQPMQKMPDLTSQWTQAFGGGAGTSPGVTGAAGGGAANGMNEWFESMKTKFTEMFGGLGETFNKLKTSLSDLLPSFDKLPISLDGIQETLGGVGDSFTELVTGPLAELGDAMWQHITAIFQNIFAEESETIANEAAAISESFANGGIMSSSGSLPLKMYSKGGIANSPQLALFGEGSMNEAYVPLPDGRSIPVTMTVPEGMGGTSVAQQVNINIVVNQAEGGNEKKTSSGEDQSQWKKMADRVKSVVKEELVAQQRPGGILFK